jgi:hypothetical protein
MPFGTPRALHLVMGNLSKNTITYSIIAAVVVMICFFGFSSGSKGSEGFSLFSRKHVKNQVTAFNGRTIFRKWESADGKTAEQAGYINNYRPTDNYANGGDDSESNGPIVGSVTYATKKKAKKIKEKKGAVAEVKSASSRSNKLSANSYDANKTSTIGGGGGGGSAGVKTAKKQKEEEENLDTMEYWAEPIFTNQDPKAVTKLVDSYQIQKVSSTTFYEVVSEMTHDERPLLREFAVVSLRATPSARSFSELAWIKLNDTDAEIRISAEQEVGRYSDVGRLNYVISSLRPTTEESQKVSLEAMKLIVAASNNYGEIRAQSTDTPKSTNQPSAALQLKLTQAYNTLGPIAQSDNALLKGEAAKTMESISKAIAI